MTVEQRAQQRLTYLIQLAAKELHHLKITDARLFHQPLDAQHLLHLAGDIDLAERIDAFGARFGRLQDTLGDELLPAYLSAHGEHLATFVENLDRAEKLGFIDDTQAWMDMRRLRNQMVHEYLEDPMVLASALNAAHAFVLTLASVTQRLSQPRLA